MAKKKGKYADVIGGLPVKPIAPEDLPRQEQINLVKAEYDQLPASTLAEQYASWRRSYDAVDAEQSLLWLKIEALQQLLTASQEAGAQEWGRYGVEDNALRLPNGDTIRVDKEPQGRVVDKEAFRLWCIANPDTCMVCGIGADAAGHDLTLEGHHPFTPGGGYERQLSLHNSTMNSLVKERLLAGEATPPGTEANVYMKVVFTPAKAPKAVEPTDSFVEVE